MDWPMTPVPRKPMRVAVGVAVAIVTLTSGVVSRIAVYPKDQLQLRPPAHERRMPYISDTVPRLRAPVVLVHGLFGFARGKDFVVPTHTYHHGDGQTDDQYGSMKRT